MNYLWGAVNAISAPYQYYKDINPATLTGAIDVIVVRRLGLNGTMEFVSSPFHVRFGKWQVLRPNEKKVDIAVNGNAVPFSMKIGEAGEAFFVFETEGDVPDDLITSPLLEPTQPVSLEPPPQEDIGRFGAREREGLSDDGQEPDFLDLDAPSTSPPRTVSKSPVSSSVSVSSMDTSSQPGRTSSDSINTIPTSVEAEEERLPKAHGNFQVTRDVAHSAMVDHGNRFTEKTPDPGELGDEASARPRIFGSTGANAQGYYLREETLNAHGGSEQQGTPRQSPLKDTVLISDTLVPIAGIPPTSREPIPFPSLRPDIPIRSSAPLPSTSTPTDDYSWEWGGFPQRSPIGMQYPAPALLKTLDGTPVDDLATASKHDEFHRSKSLPPEFELDFSDEPPSTSPAEAEQIRGLEPLSDVETDFSHGPSSPSQEYRSWVRWWRRDRRLPGGVDVRVERSHLKNAASTPLASEMQRASTVDVPALDEGTRGSSTILRPTLSESLASSTSPPSQGKQNDSQVRYAKSLRLTSEQLQALDLRPGPNTITFSLASSGVVACAARIFLWEHTDSVVVSDIDGTITKSDALGHMFTLIGRDWTHLGVAKLYTDIYKNGYKIMYLTSRAIGQADSTRYYLQGIKQNDYQLPEGPVIMSPDRLMASLHREVIMRKPEVFKMACLRDIQRLFGPATPHPFYAGFGNRITDALSYRSVNIPSSRIFTIDSLGEVKMELLDLVGHKSESVRSYIHMTDLVDQMFPPITHKWDNEFTASNYWKTPLTEFPLPDLAPPSPALSARSDTSNKSAFARLRNFSLRSTSSSRSRSFASSLPLADARRGRDMDSTGAHSHQRQLSSIERVSNVLANLASRSVSPGTPSSYESESEGDEDSHGASDVPGRHRRSRKRSTRSMPGSLPGSPPSSDDEDLEFGVTDKGVLDDTASGQMMDMAEQEFDEDLFATISKMAHY
ncbi:LNS2-domain-containing protein [Lactarius hatsudake]|nr:LNS2-domain-containing protein [Lactarius hatsudake]